MAPVAYPLLRFESMESPRAAAGRGFGDLPFLFDMGASAEESKSDSSDVRSVLISRPW